MGNMASYIASGLSWEDAFKAMQEDGTLDLLGMTESDIESMYNKLMLNQNPILQAEETYQQLLDSGVINQEEFDDMMDFLTWGLTHPEGVDISDGYMVTDKNGNEVGFFKTQEEANAFIEKYPDSGYESNFMKNHIGEKDVGPDSGGDGFDNFSFGIPDEFLEFITQEDWEAAGSPETWEKFNKDNPDFVVNKLKDKINDRRPLTPAEYDYYKANAKHGELPWENVNLKDVPTSEINEWLAENVDKVFKGSDGELYRVGRIVLEGNNVYIRLTSLMDDSIVHWNGGSI